MKRSGSWFFRSGTRGWAFAFVFCLIGLHGSQAPAITVDNLTFNEGTNDYHIWAFTSDGSSFWGGAAGEYQGDIDEVPVVGYFTNPFATGVTTGDFQPLSSTEGTHEAAWLIDTFAVGLGNDWLPEGLSGYTEVQARTALAFAVFEVCTSPAEDPLDLSSGGFAITQDDTGSLPLAQAYLDELSQAQVDAAELESRYEIVESDRWNGFDYPKWVANAAPEPATLCLLAVGVVAAVGRRRRK